MMYSFPCFLRSVAAWKNERKRYPINYEKLKELVSIEGLKRETEEASTPESHKKFMKTVQEIFIKPVQTDVPAVAQLMR